LRHWKSKRSSQQLRKPGSVLNMLSWDEKGGEWDKGWIPEDDALGKAAFSKA
jgi:hypothetical protein